MAIAAIDIGGTKIATGMVDDQGNLLAKRVFATQADLGLENGMRWIIESLETCAGEAGTGIDGMGISCTGPVYKDGELAEKSFLKGWEGRGLVEGLHRHFGLDMAIDNDANAAALAEYAWGAGRGVASMMYITISTGIGSGWVLHGQIQDGSGGFHPEIGHHAIDLSGPRCFCGMNGCWESLASGPSWAAWAQAQYPQHARRFPDAAAICAAAVEGDVIARELVAREARYIGIGLSNVITLMLPDMIVLGGGVMKSFNLFIGQVQDVIRQSCGLVPHERVQIVPARCGEWSGLLGAAQVYLKAREMDACIRF